MSENRPTAAYPVVDSWDNSVELLLPSMAARGQSTAWVQGLAVPLADVDNVLAGIVEATTDLGLASGAVLDLIGNRTGEPRGGLADHEYRSIIAGRWVAQARAVIPTAVWDGWLALTGADSANPILRMYELSPASVLLVGPIGWTPTEVWLRRAGRVVRDLVGAGIDCDAFVAPSGTAIYDSVPGFGAGAYAFQLGV